MTYSRAPERPSNLRAQLNYWIRFESRADAKGKLFLHTIAGLLDVDTRVAWPSVSTLSLQSSLSVKSVQRAKKDLVLLGELRIYLNEGPGGTDLYEFTAFPMTTKPGETDRHPRQNPRLSDGQKIKKEDTSPSRVESNSSSFARQPDAPQKRHDPFNPVFPPESPRSEEEAIADMNREIERRRKAEGYSSPLDRWKASLGSG